MTVATERETVTRETLPTASFSLTVSLIAWIAEEAKRRGVSKSELVRQVLDNARTEEQEAKAA